MIKYVRNSDGTYGPTAQVRKNEPVKYYRPKVDHGKNAKKRKHKTRWKIEESYEFHVFKITAEPNYFCEENNCLFSLVEDGNQELGENSEKVAKFPNVQNEGDAWHGYPVKCEESQNTPCDILLDIMIKGNFISESTRQRIEKKKI